MLISCFIVSFLCNFDSDFAYLLFARFIDILFVCFFLLAYCRVHCVNLAIWLLYVNKLACLLTSFTKRLRCVRKSSLSAKLLQMSENFVALPSDPVFQRKHVY